jgi:hypothetical protein
MAGNRGNSNDNDHAMGRDPLGDDDDVLGRTIFGGEREERPKKSKRKQRKRKRKSSKSKPSHYKVISISLYNEDIERLDAMVDELKKMGHTKANRSALIRFALDKVDIEEMPRSY